MRFGLAVKEKLARVIADHFTTNEIVNVFADANIPTDKALFAKWKIVVDAFGKMSAPEEAIPHILEVLCHPLNFEDQKIRNVFAEAKKNNDLETRKEIFATLGSDLILKAKMLSIDWDNLLFPMQTMAKELRAIHAELEPVENGINTKDLSEIYSQNPILLRG